jgi:hypothetical protein
MTFNIRLGAAFYNQGFIYIKKRYQEYFGSHDSNIKIYLGSWNEVPLEGRINRTAQPSGSPRIMMGITYTNWVQINHQQGENLTVEILNPNHPNSILII